MYGVHRGVRELPTGLKSPRKNNYKCIRPRVGRLSCRPLKGGVLGRRQRLTAIHQVCKGFVDERTGSIMARLQGVNNSLVMQGETNQFLRRLSLQKSARWRNAIVRKSETHFIINEHDNSDCWNNCTSADQRKVFQSRIRTDRSRPDHSRYPVPCGAADT